MPKPKKSGAGRPRKSVHYVYYHKRNATTTPAYRPVRVARVPKSGSLARSILGKDPFPPSMDCKLHYAESYLLQSGTAGVVGTEQICRLSSLYDVNYSGTGAQPYGYDQITPLYNKYVVKAVDVKVTFYDPNVEGMVACLTMQPSGSSATLTGTGIDALQMQPMTWTRYIPSSGGQSRVFRQYIKIHRLEGLTKSQFEGAIDEYASLVSQSPVITPYIRMAVAAVRGDSGATMVCKFEVCFYCHFFDRKTLPVS